MDLKCLPLGSRLKIWFPAEDTEAECWSTRVRVGPEEVEQLAGICIWSIIVRWNCFNVGYLELASGMHRDPTSVARSSLFTKPPDRRLASVSHSTTANYSVTGSVIFIGRSWHTLQYAHVVGIEKAEPLKRCGFCSPSSPIGNFIIENSLKHAYMPSICRTL